MTEQKVKEQSVCDIIRELNDHHESFLKVIAEDVHARAKQEAKR